MSVNMKLSDGTRIKKEPGSDSQFAEVDSSTNSTATNSAAETTTRQSSLQRIQLRKEKVNSFIGSHKKIINMYINLLFICNFTNSYRSINYQKNKKWQN